MIGIFLVKLFNYHTHTLATEAKDANRVRNRRVVFSHLRFSLNYTCLTF